MVPLVSKLHHMSLGKGFICMIRLLYTNSTATFLTGNNLSHFTLARGSRQGCPLLFALSIEPMALPVSIGDMKNIRPPLISSPF